MTSVAPEEPEAGYVWRERKPSMYGLPGRKMYLMNMYSFSSRNTEGALTDDPRLYAVLAAKGIPAALITQRRRTNQNLRNHWREGRPGAEAEGGDQNGPGGPRPAADGT